MSSHVDASPLFRRLTSDIAALHAPPAPGQEYASIHDSLCDADRETATRLGLNPDDCELVMWVACGWSVEEMADTYLGQRPVYHSQWIRP